jgi:glycosyltransferase involved in cell wall biosynthesis
MRIVVLGTRGFPNVQGGVEAHCENLYPHLVKRGCEVVILARKPYVNSAIDTYEGVKLIPLYCPKNKFLEAFLHTFYGVFVAMMIRPDILHFHAVGPSLFIPLARLFGLKVVMTNHGPDYQRKKWGKLAKAILELGEKLGSKWANSIICISKSIADNIRRKYNRDAVVIPNGVVIPQISQRDDVLRKYALENGKYLLSVGRFVPEKGFHDLIDAFDGLKTHGSQPHTNGWKLVIVGDADHPDKYSLGLKEQAKKNENIILTGFLKGKPLQELYSHAGLFVLPSYYEGLPIVLLEAMSYGLSCIASDIPANRNVELPEDRYIKVGNIEALSTKIKEFTNMPLSLEERRAQVNMIAQKYDWGKIADRLLGVYRQVLGGITVEIDCI